MKGCYVILTALTLLLLLPSAAVADDQCPDREGQIIADGGPGESWVLINRHFGDAVYEDTTQGATGNHSWYVDALEDRGAYVAGLELRLPTPVDLSWIQDGDYLALVLKTDGQFDDQQGRLWIDIVGDDYASYGRWGLIDGIPTQPGWQVFQWQWSQYYMLHGQPDWTNITHVRWHYAGSDDYGDLNIWIGLIQARSACPEPAAALPDRNASEQFVPEPASAILLLTGLGALFGFRKLKG